MSKKLFVVLILGTASILALSAQNPSAAVKRIAVNIDAAKTAPPISPYMYGQFIEHIGDLINRSLWAEMLDDRKFYNDITSNPPQAGRGGRGGGGGAGRGGHVTATWMPVGPDGSVTMDRKNPYVGDHSPLIQLAGDSARGIQQSGIALIKGKAYTGRVVLAGSPGAKVTVALVWGDGPTGRQAVPMPALSAAYAKFPVKFTAGAESANGHIEIGKGRLKLECNSRQRLKRGRRLLESRAGKFTFDFTPEHVLSTIHADGNATLSLPESELKSTNALTGISMPDLSGGTHLLRPPGGRTEVVGLASHHHARSLGRRQAHGMAATGVCNPLT